MVFMIYVNSIEIRGSTAAFIKKLKKKKKEEEEEEKTLDTF